MRTIPLARFTVTYISQFIKLGNRSRRQWVTYVYIPDQLDPPFLGLVDLGGPPILGRVNPLNKWIPPEQVEPASFPDGMLARCRMKGQRVM